MCMTLMVGRGSAVIGINVLKRLLDDNCEAAFYIFGAVTFGGSFDFFARFRFNIPVIIVIFIHSRTRTGSSVVPVFIGILAVVRKILYFMSLLSYTHVGFQSNPG